MPINVFFSVGRTSTSQQEDFVRAIEQYLQSSGLIPQTVGRSYNKNQQPLKSVQECMGECSGTLVLAFERSFIAQGLEKRGSANEAVLNQVKLPTVWNQIEAAMSYSSGLPILVIVENGIKSEGLLEKGYDWFVNWVDLDKSPLTDP